MGIAFIPSRLVHSYLDLHHNVSFVWNIQTPGIEFLERPEVWSCCTCQSFFHTVPPPRLKRAHSEPNLER